MALELQRLTLNVEKMEAEVALAVAKMNGPSADQPAVEALADRVNIAADALGAAVNPAPTP